MAYSPIRIAIKLLQSGEIDKARETLQVSDSEISDSRFVEQLTSLSIGLDLVFSDKIIESIEHLHNSIELVNGSNDQEAKTLLPLLIRYAQGIDLLHSGDAFGAYQEFQFVSTSTEKISFFDANLQRFSLVAKATSSIAVARSNMAAGNMDESQKWMASSESTYQELLELLDENEPNDFATFIEIYALSVEIGSVWSYYDLQVLDIEEAINRLSLYKEKFNALKNFTSKIKKTTATKKISLVIISIYEAVEKLSILSKKLLTENSSLNSEDLVEIKSLINKLSKSRQLALQAGKRGHGSLWLLKQLQRFAKNLIHVKSIGKKEIGKFSGLISFIVFIITLPVIKFVFEPGQVLGIGYYIGTLIFSLIIGFGVGALKFIPLLNTYKEILKEIKQD